MSIDKMSTDNKAGQPKDLAGRLQMLRRRHGISQEELADAVGVSRQAVSKWEGAQSTPDIERLLALSGYFGVSTDWLLKGVELPAPEPLPNPAEPQTGRPGGYSTRQQIFLAVTTALNYTGLLLAWAIWDYWQIGLATFVGIIFMVVAGALLSVGLFDAVEPARDELWRRFWRYNIWPMAYLLIAVVYSWLVTYGGWVVPVISWKFIYSFGELFYAYAAWLIICVMVSRWARHKPQDDAAETMDMAADGNADINADKNAE